MGGDDKKYLVIKFNISYYFVKNERLFKDFHKLIALQEKNRVKGIGKAYLKWALHYPFN